MEVSECVRGHPGNMTWIRWIDMKWRILKYIEHYWTIYKHTRLWDHSSKYSILSAFMGIFWGNPQLASPRPGTCRPIPPRYEGAGCTSTTCRNSVETQNRQPRRIHGGSTAHCNLLWILRLSLIDESLTNHWQIIWSFWEWSGHCQQDTWIILDILGRFRPN